MAKLCCLARGQAAEKEEKTPFVLEKVSKATGISPEIFSSERAVSTELGV